MHINEMKKYNQRKIESPPSPLDIFLDNNYHERRINDSWPKNDYFSENEVKVKNSLFHGNCVLFLRYFYYFFYFHILNYSINFEKLWRHEEYYYFHILNYSINFEKL